MKKITCLEKAQAHVADLKRREEFVRENLAAFAELEKQIDAKNAAAARDPVPSAGAGTTTAAAEPCEKVNTADSSGSGADLIAELNAITDPIESTRFYRKNQAAIDAAYRNPATSAGAGERTTAAPEPCEKLNADDSTGSGADLIAELNAITDPIESTLFYRKNQAAIDAAYRDPATAAQAPKRAHRASSVASSVSPSCSTSSVMPGAAVTSSEPTMEELVAGYNALEGNPAGQTLFMRLNDAAIRRASLRQKNPNVHLPPPRS